VLGNWSAQFLCLAGLFLSPFGTGSHSFAGSRLAVGARKLSSCRSSGGQEDAEGGCSYMIFFLLRGGNWLGEGPGAIGRNFDLNDLVLDGIDDQVADGVQAELSHDVAAMRLNGFGTQIEQ